jgi:hypothetical protein
MVLKSRLVLLRFLEDAKQISFEEPPPSIRSPCRSLSISTSLPSSPPCPSISLSYLTSSLPLALSHPRSPPTAPQLPPPPHTHTHTLTQPPPPPQPSLLALCCTCVCCGSCCDGAVGGIRRAGGISPGRAVAREGKARLRRAPSCRAGRQR